MKPYQKIPIQESFEPLIPIPPEIFLLETPHPYEKLGANYQGLSPYCLRETVLASLIQAQENLTKLYPGWKIKVFDAYRPVNVQQFMVDYSFNYLVKQKQLNPQKLSLKQRQELLEQVYKIWAIPSEDPKTPPPHSTGAAVDITLVNAEGDTVDMGSEIDELSDRSHPNYYANTSFVYHQRRELLKEIMIAAGFRRHPGEWWHFSEGDQMWAMQCQQENPTELFIARYGRI